MGISTTDAWVFPLLWHGQIATPRSQCEGVLTNGVLPESKFRRDLLCTLKLRFLGILPMQRRSPSHQKPQSHRTINEVSDEEQCQRMEGSGNSTRSQPATNELSTSFHPSAHVWPPPEHELS